jgi:hypothetical protein
MNLITDVANTVKSKLQRTPYCSPTNSLAENNKKVPDGNLHWTGGGLDSAGSQQMFSPNMRPEMTTTVKQARETQ